MLGGIAATTIDTRTTAPERFDPFAGAPRLHGAARIGIRPGTELIHPLAATGTRPIRIEVDGLPSGTTVDADGTLRGRAPASRGTHHLTVTATNALGTTTATRTLEVGDALALTPPMGWNSWNVYAGDVSAEVIVRTARAMVDTGLRDLGYQYVNIDDHWHAAARNADGTPRADPETFPDGIAAVAEEVHALGLKLGIYSDAGRMTCGNCYGGFGYERIDAEAYASWGVDLLKYDYCYAPASAREAKARYGAMADALQQTGRSIVLSVCEWGFRRPWQWAPGLGGSLWRSTPDIFDTFSWSPFGVRAIARRNLALADHAGPGRWNDPDMLLVGNHGRGRSTGSLKLPNQFPPPLRGRRIWSFRGLTDAQVQSHVTLWAMMAAPLLASHDLAATTDDDLALLANPELLAVDQDPLGAQARLVPTTPGLWQLVKPLADGGVAVSVTNLTRVPRRTTLDLRALASAGHATAIPSDGCSVTDAWSLQDLGSPHTIRAHIDGHSTVAYVLRPKPDRPGLPT